MAASVTKYWKGGGILKFQKVYEKLFEITASQHSLVQIQQWKQQDNV